MNNESDDIILSRAYYLGKLLTGTGKKEITTKQAGETILELVNMFRKTKIKVRFEK